MACEAFEFEKVGRPVSARESAPNSDGKVELWFVEFDQLVDTDAKPRQTFAHTNVDGHPLASGEVGLLTRSTWQHLCDQVVDNLSVWTGIANDCSGRRGCFPPLVQICPWSGPEDGSGEAAPGPGERIGLMTDDLLVEEGPLSEFEGHEEWWIIDGPNGS